ncbi:E3 ubiquitin-protein ligase Zswim2 [Liparis tanakae]|uniref:E3 ubiquitin-protein ligase Zswim2 n=1 Tax=Liparis tanakae TaxID=230148 RepID=A0A4Z2G735_9TELE|nr:E3 ubiquitin-protein ligase Zswim2 [Liparis tanakae]
MFRNTCCRNTASAAVARHQDQALNTTLFLLKAFGPTGFLLREEGEVRDAKHGLVERQILELLGGLHRTKERRTGGDSSDASGAASPPAAAREAGSVCRRAIHAQDVCPICQEGLLEKKLPVSHCRFGCGNNVHVSCMKVWAEHQGPSDGDEAVRCPLCRERFSSRKLLRELVRSAARLSTASEREKPDRHLGVLCHGCRLGPVTGTCFKCTVCRHVYLCEDCSLKGCHPQHPFASRTKRREEWRLVADDLKGLTSQSADDSLVPAAADPLPRSVLHGLYTVRVRPGSPLLDAGQQCRLCLLDFELGQRVRTLPCRHKFHADCVDGILQESNACPLDGYVIYSPAACSARDRKPSSRSAATRPELNLKDLFVPGVALRGSNPKVTPSRGSLRLEVLPSSPVTSDTSQRRMADRFQGLCFAAEEGTIAALHPASSMQRASGSSHR